MVARGSPKTYRAARRHNPEDRNSIKVISTVRNSLFDIFIWTVGFAYTSN
jgi:hypothetical protein